MRNPATELIEVTREDLETMLTVFLKEHPQMKIFCGIHCNNLYVGVLPAINCPSCNSRIRLEELFHA